MFIESKQLFHWSRTFHKGREIARCKRLIAGVMMFAAAAVAEAAPTGGDVDYGSADISLGQHTLIEQYSQRVDIDWTGFDTASDESVTFDQQQGPLSVAINRISGNRTQFDGILNANGRIFLINRNGITFGSGAQVNVGSLLATTSDTDRVIEDEAMLDAQANGSKVYEFDNSGYASIVNEGDITVSNGGFAVLAAPNVVNNGYIQADLGGQIELASTREFTLHVDVRGDGLITFDVPQDFFEDDEILVDGPIGVTSTGTLQSRSGRVYLTANKVSSAIQNSVNLSGVVDADQFVAGDNGGVMMVASSHPAYPGGTIKVVSNGDINIGGGADIHAVGGERVSGYFVASGDINMGAEDDPATITLQAFSDRAGDANAEARLVMLSETGSLNIAEGRIEVTADASAVDSADGYTAGYGGDNNARAVATALLQGEHVDINADITVRADARATSTDDYGNGIDDVGIATCHECEGDGQYGAEALAVLDVFATGDRTADYPAPGDLALTGDINVTADAYTDGSRTARSTANTVLAATGNLDVEGDIEVHATATSDTDGYGGPLVDASTYDCQDLSCNDGSGEAADANAALVMLGGAPGALLAPLRNLSFNELQGADPLSDIMTLVDIHDFLDLFGGSAGLDGLPGHFGSGGVTYKGDINVTSLAEYNAIGTTGVRGQGLAQATSAAYIVGGGDTYINTDPIRVKSWALANYDDYFLNGYDYNASLNNNNGAGSYVDTEARSFLVMAAGLGDIVGGYGPAVYNGDNGDGHSDLTILGDVSASAFELETLNGDPHPLPYNPLTGALTALLATGDITVRGADPLAEAGPLSDPDLTARVQGRHSMWQTCDRYGCYPVVAGIDGLDRFSDGSSNIYLAQLIIEAGGDIDIQPKSRDVQPAGLYLDPIGPGWPGDKPLRFDANGQMLVATGADVTRPSRFVALDSDVEAAILAGADPSTLLPPTAAGGCVAAGRDAFTVSGADYFDRLISTSCESKQ